MPPKKRRKQEHPQVEQWTALSNVAAKISKCTRQQQQYIALMLQISELTQHDVNVPDNPWTVDNIDFETIVSYVLSCVDDLDSNRQLLSGMRDATLQGLRQVDLEDVKLKKLAFTLTELEAKLMAIESFSVKWKKIVRFTESTLSLREHTDKWLQRWLKQWSVTNNTQTKLMVQFQETLGLLPLTNTPGTIAL